MVSNERNCAASAASPYRAAHGVPEHLADFERLGHQHRRLIRAPDAGEVAVRVEAGRGRIRETVEEGGAVAAATDVVADDLRLAAIEHDEVAAARVLQCLRRGRACLFVLDLSVDDRVNPSCA